MTYPKPIEPGCTRFLVYARVSERGSNWRAEESTIQQQIEICSNWVRIQGGQIVDTVSDEFLSGGNIDRAGLLSIIARLESGAPDFDVLIVRDTSRLARDVRGGLDIRELLAKSGCGFVSIAENIDYSTPIGRYFFTQNLALAQLKREEISRDTRAKMMSIARAGGWPAGNPPFGFRRAKTGPKNQLHPCPIKAPIVRDIFARVTRGESVTVIWRDYRDTISHSKHVYRILRNPAYIGKIQYGGETFEGLHDAIVPPDIWMSIQATLPKAVNKPRPGAQKYDYLLTGRIFTAEGHAMSPSSAYGRRGQRYNYYRSTATDSQVPQVPAPEIEDAVMRCLLLMPIDDDYRRGWMRAVDDERARRQHALAGELQDTTTAIRAATQDRDRINALFLDGLVNPSNAAHFNAQLSAANARLAALQSQRDEIVALLPDDNAPDLAAELITQISHIRTAAAQADSIPARRALIQTYVRRLTVHTRTTAHITLTPWGSSKSIKWYPLGYLLESVRGAWGVVRGKYAAAAMAMVMVMFCVGCEAGADGGDGVTPVCVVAADPVAGMASGLDRASLPDLPGMEVGEFRALVRSAIGWDAVPDGRVQEVGTGMDYRGGQLRRGVVRYEVLGVEVPYLLATHGEPGRRLVTVLHGHFSSAAAVLGVAELDYMGGLGAELYDRGYDVLALDVTRGMEASEYLNGQLALYGVQIYGLWADATVRATAHYAAGRPLVGLYGLSNGGLVAQFVSVMEGGPFDVVIVGDILTDWRALGKAHPSLHHQQNYSLYFLAPLWARARPADFVAHATVPTWYTCTTATRERLPASVDATRLVDKRVEAHVPEPQLIVELLQAGTKKPPAR